MKLSAKIVGLALMTSFVAVNAYAAEAAEPAHNKVEKKKDEKKEDHKADKKDDKKAADHK